jgi:hypothetical protein
MPRAAAAGVTGMFLEHPLMITGCERGAMTFLTAFPTAEHVCMASGQLLVVSAVFQLTGDLRCPVLLLLLLRLFAEQATARPP